MLVQGQGPCSDTGGLQARALHQGPGASGGLLVCPQAGMSRGGSVERWCALHTAPESLPHLLPQLPMGMGAGQGSGLQDTVWLPHTPALLVHQHSRTGFSIWPQTACSEARTKLHGAVYLPLGEAECTLCALETQALEANAETKWLGLPDAKFNLVQI